MSFETDQVSYINSNLLATTHHSLESFNQESHHGIQGVYPKKIRNIFNQFDFILIYLINNQQLLLFLKFQFITLFALVAAANAGFLPVAPVAYSPSASLGYAHVAKVATPVITKHVDEEYDPHPQYNYSKLNIFFNLLFSSFSLMLRYT